MTQRTVRITIPEDDAELEIVGLSVARALQERGVECSSSRDDTDVVSIASTSGTIRLGWDATRAALVDRDWPVILTPAVHSSLVPPSVPSPSRIMFRGETPSRRTRMLERVVRELRRRGISRSVACAGEFGEDWVDETFPSLTATETLRLMAASHVMVDAASDQDRPHLLVALAIACGCPVVTSAPERYSPGTNVVAVGEWNADAFCDAIAGVQADLAQPSGVDAFADALEKALALG